jgi:uncharacterized RDD family membrane protein YckC
MDEPERRRGPQSPAGPEAPAYGGAVPPGGWERPVGPPKHEPQEYMSRLATWGSRFAAWLIDALIMVVPWLVAAGVTFLATRSSVLFAVLTGLLTAALAFAVSVVYASVLMARKDERNGQTWGKQAMGIRVIRVDGQPVDFFFAALREVVVKNLAVGIASTMLAGLPWLANYLWPLWDDENRAVHDMAVDTRVIVVHPG